MSDTSPRPEVRSAEVRAAKAAARRRALGFDRWARPAEPIATLAIRYGVTTRTIERDLRALRREGSLPRGTPE